MGRLLTKSRSWQKGAASSQQPAQLARAALEIRGAALATAVYISAAGVVPAPTGVVEAAVHVVQVLAAASVAVDVGGDVSEAAHGVGDRSSKGSKYVALALWEVFQKKNSRPKKAFLRAGGEVGRGMLFVLPGTLPHQQGWPCRTGLVMC